MRSQPFLFFFVMTVKCVLEILPMPLPFSSVSSFILSHSDTCLLSIFLFLPPSSFCKRKRKCVILQVLACLIKEGGKKNLKLKFAGFQSWLVDNSYIFHMLLFFILCPFSISILMLRLFLFFFDGGRSATLNTSLGPPVSAAADVASRVIRIEIVFLHLPVLVAGVASIALSPCRSLVGRV